MNLGVVTLITVVLSAPAVTGMLDGSVLPEQAGIRLLLALLCAVVVETVVRHFLTAVGPEPPREGAGTPERTQAGEPRRRRSDG